MSLRETSLIGVLALVVTAGILVFVQLRSSHESPEAPPFFYELQPESITRVAISHAGATETFAWDEASNEWEFAGTGQAVDPERWGGMPVLLSGPRIERTLPVSTDLAQYGLQPPQTKVAIGLEDGSEFTVFIGTKTPDGGAHYVMQAGSLETLLIDSAWANLIEGMVADPPHLEPGTGIPNNDLAA